MDTILMNSENNKTSKPHVLVLYLTDKIDLWRDEKLLLYQILVFTIQGKTKKLYNNNKFKISAPTWNDKFQLPDKSNSVSNIQDYFEYGENTDNPSIKIYVNIIENRITFKIKTGYYLELLMPTTMKLLGSTENKKTNDKNGENVPHLKITEVVLVHCNIVNNDYQQIQESCIRLLQINRLVVY